MRRRLVTLAAGASAVLCAVTALLWLAHAIQTEFDVGLLRWRTRLGPRVEVTAGLRLSAERYAGYGIEVEREGPRVTGPKYLTPQYAAWEKPFRSRDRRFDLLGFRCWRWGAISNYPDRAEFRGYSYGAEVPYWLVCAVTVVVPVLGFARRRRRQRRSRRGCCPACGYDLRATPDRCPECGTAAAR